MDLCKLVSAGLVADELVRVLGCLLVWNLHMDALQDVCCRWSLEITSLHRICQQQQPNVWLVLPTNTIQHRGQSNVRVGKPLSRQNRQKLQHAGARTSSTFSVQTEDGDSWVGMNLGESMRNQAEAQCQATANQIRYPKSCTERRRLR